MNRNVESHFSELPNVDIERSIMDRSSGHMTSFNVGELIPFFVDEVLPGDSFRITTSKVIRLQTLLTPIFSNLYLDTYYFFVPNRLTWNHWNEFCGENTDSAWVQPNTYQVPSISAPSGGFATGTIADYLGLPVGVNWTAGAKHAPSALPFRAYALICNEFFRDENLTDPLNIPLGDANQTGTNGDSYINDVANGGKPFKVAKYHDYFTSCLPSPLKAAKEVTFPLISGEKAPVNAYQDLTIKAGDTTDKITNILFGNITTGNPPRTVSDYTGLHTVGMNGDGFYHTAAAGGTPDGYATPLNLWADLSTSVGAVSINQLRLAFQLQKFYERNARGGTRYIEILKSHFGVTSPDARLQRPEYLGGNRTPIEVHQVTNSAQTDNDYLGDVGAMSVTSDINEDVEHSFVEHGLIIGVCCLRYDHSYPQSLEPFWQRKSFTDFYLPVFSSIGEQPVNSCTICATEENLDNDDVFGYQEAWAEYRYKPDRVSGELRPGIPNSLASWHFADYYNAVPTLSDGWIREDKTNVDRTLAVTSANANQAFADFYIKNICTRPMPMYSIPGLIDHH